MECGLKLDTYALDEYIINAHGNIVYCDCSVAWVRNDPHTFDYYNDIFVCQRREELSSFIARNKCQENKCHGGSVSIHYRMINKN